MENKMQEIDITIRFLERKLSLLGNKIQRMVTFTYNTEEELKKIRESKEYKELQEQYDRWDNKRTELETELEKIIDEKFNFK